MRKSLFNVNISNIKKHTKNYQKNGKGSKLLFSSTLEATKPPITNSLFRHALCFFWHTYPLFTRKQIVSLQFWTERPHSLGSCHLRYVWATCFPHKGGGVPLSALPKDTTSELAGLFSTTSPKCQAPSRKAVDTIY